MQAVWPLASPAEIKGDGERAAEPRREGVRPAQESRLWPGVADRLTGLGRIALLTKDYERAREFHERGRDLAA
ncbi:hypothetical protein [Nonomuraea sp. NPDC049480]|uniref:hypothetical protein n=1 Tax=Nonomuraea sp. NPDC049480 TaxID=3364353 RepID=UPI0037AFABDE